MVNRKFPQKVIDISSFNRDWPWLKDWITSSWISMVKYGNWKNHLLSKVQSAKWSDFEDFNLSF